MASYSHEGFEELAKAVRTTLGIDDQLVLNPIDFLRRLKHAGYINDYVRLPDASMRDAEAKYNPDEKKIYLRESVYVGAEKGNPHFSFTVFHEGAHALLGHQHERKRSFDTKARIEKTVPSIRKDEDDTDYLTAALMAPYHKADFSPAVTAADIARKFNLSASAAVRRSDEFGRMYRRANNLRRPLPKGVSDFLHEQRRRGYLVTSLPADEIRAIKPREVAYAGNACPNPDCGQFRMVRRGTMMRCEGCGTITGDD